MTSHKRFTIFFLLFLFVIFFVSGCQKPQEELIRISIQVSASSILAQDDIGKKIGNEKAEFLRQNGGVILEEKDLTVDKSEGLAKILQDELTYKDINQVIRKDFFGSYIESIFDISEKMFGFGSGWIYFINDVSPSSSIGSYNIKDGDKVKILYTCDMGNDL